MATSNNNVAPSEGEKIRDNLPKKTYLTFAQAISKAATIVKQTINHLSLFLSLFRFALSPKVHAAVDNAKAHPSYRNRPII
jgi:hypothetical protein